MYTNYLGFLLIEQAKCMGDENMVRRQQLIYGNFPAAF